MEMPVPRYRPVAIILHWAIAALLMFQLGLGWHMTSMPRSAVMFDAFQFHKSIGIAVLLLSLLRVAVRLALPRPAPVGGARWRLCSPLACTGCSILL
jgi:cytochrome b561